MKYTFALCAALIACLLPGCFGSAKPSTSTHEYLFKEGILNNPILKEILTITETPHDGTLESINKAIQGKREEKDYEGWIRQGERWDAKNIYEDKREQLLPLFAALKYVNALYPTNKEYRYVFVLGSLAKNVRKRLAFLKEEWGHGVHAHQIILLGSARPLNENIETEDMLLNDQSILPFRPGWNPEGKLLPKTEYEMMKFIKEQADLPQDILDRITVLDTPMKPEGRPNTQDTINTWLATDHPEPGTILAISHQPYVLYQDAVIRSVLPKNFTLETIGSAAEPNERMAMYLDSLARVIYQERADSLASKK